MDKEQNIQNAQKREPKTDVKFTIQLSEEQKEAKRNILIHPYNFIEGKTGSGKTLLATSIALDLFFKRQVNKIYITRPTVGTEDNGFLPGELSEKLAPWMVPIKDNMRKVYNYPEKLEKHYKNNDIELVALSHFRGITMENAVCIIDECFPYDTYVKTDSGKSRIRKIVNDYRRGITTNVLSYNDTTDTFEYKPVIGASSKFVNNLYKIKFKDNTIRCTDNHRILTSTGYKRADELLIGDIGIFNGTSNKSSKLIHSEDIAAIVMGSAIGDGHIHDLKDGVFRVCYTHGIVQENYCKWKLNALNGSFQYIEENGYAKTVAIHGSSTSMMIPNIDMTNYTDIINNLNWKSIAIAWMDDGTKFVKDNGGILWCFPMDQLLTELLANKLTEMGVKCSVGTSDKYHVVRITSDGLYELSKNIAKYLLKEFTYKVHDDFKDEVGSYMWNTEYLNVTCKPVTDISIMDGECEVFDIEVEDNHNFVVSRSVNNTAWLIVHNCQNLTKQQLTMALGRLGKGSIMIFCGDSQQIDLPNAKNSAMHDVAKIEGSRFVYRVQLTENHRHEAVDEVLTLLGK